LHQSYQDEVITGDTNSSHCTNTKKNANFPTQSTLNGVTVFFFFFNFCCDSRSPDGREFQAVCLSVRMKQLGCCRMDFHDSSYSEVLKLVERNSILRKIGQNNGPLAHSFPFLTQTKLFTIYLVIKMTLKSHQLLHVSTLLGHLQEVVHLLNLLTALDLKSVYFHNIACRCSH
jgi:hypothetical protein